MTAGRWVKNTKGEYVVEDLGVKPKAKKPNIILGAETKMKLWRENRLDQEWESTFEEIYQGFKASEWYDVTYPLERKLALYMTDSKYLNSTYEKADFSKLVDYIIKRRGKNKRR